MIRQDLRSPHLSREFGAGGLGALNDLGDILRQQGDPGCLLRYQEAIDLARKARDRVAEAQSAGSLGSVYIFLPGLGTWTRPSAGSGTASVCAPTTTGAAGPSTSTRSARLP